jgi:hypothetical protein
MVKITSRWVPSKYILSLLIVALGVGIISSQAYATAIYSQAPNQTSGWISDQAFLYETADNFTLGSAATVFSIEWYGGYTVSGDRAPPLGSDNFKIRFYSDAGGNPSESAFNVINVGGSYSRVATGLIVQGIATEYHYVADIPAFTLGAGTYYLSIVNNTAGTGGDIFFWEYGTGGDIYLWDRYPAPGLGAWFPPKYQSDMAFTLNTPIPSTMLLLGSGLVGLVGIDRKRFRK